MDNEEYDVNAWIDGNLLNVEMSTCVYNIFAQIAKKYGLSPEEAIIKHLDWIIAHPFEFKKWYNEQGT